MTWHPEPIAGAVREQLARFGGAGALADVVAAWPEAVGPAIAENAWPARAGRDGTLVVATSSSVWAFELTKLGEDVAARLRNRLGERAPARLRFAVGRLPERGGAEPVTTSSRSAPIVGDAERHAGEKIAAPIENEELRELVARAAAASLAPRPRKPDDRRLW